MHYTSIKKKSETRKENIEWALLFQRKSTTHSKGSRVSGRALSQGKRKKKVNTTRMNTQVLLVATLLVACVSCFSETEYQSEFTNWMQSFKKFYTAEDFQGKYSAFKNNMDYVQQWNSVNNETKRMFFYTFAYYYVHKILRVSVQRRGLNF